MATSSPVFSDRSRGNLGLSAEHDQIDQKISAALKKRSQIKEQIAHFKAILDDLYLEDQVLDRYIYEHRTMITGKRQLPTELIQAIFRYCLPARNAAMRSDEAPLLLGRVCSKWRQIAYATPQLWSSIHVCLPRINGPYPLYEYRNPVYQTLKQYGEAIEAWLYRASDTPLSISFSITDRSRNMWGGGLWTSKHILGILVRFCRQWKNFTLSGACRQPIFEISSEADFPLLETVVLGNDALVDHLFLLHTPSLRSVSLLRFPELNYSWADITHLTLGSGSVESESTILLSPQALDVLRSCSNLISCMLTVEVDEVLDTGRIRLPSLAVLRIKLYMHDGDVDNDEALAFFFSIEAPTLAHFGFKSINTSHLSVPFLSLFTQPNVIEAVEYVDFDILDSFTDTLAFNPSIRRLRVVAIGLLPNDDTEDCDRSTKHENFLTRLSIDPNQDSHICPCLDEIEIELPKSGDVREQVLLQFLLSRTDRVPPGVKHLRRARVVLHRHRSIDILPDLSRAIERGLQVEIIYRPLELTVSYFPSSDLHLAVDPVEWNREFLPSI